MWVITSHFTLTSTMLYARMPALELVAAMKLPVERDK